MSSGRRTRVARPAQKTSVVRRTPSAPSARTKLNTADTGTLKPSSRRARQKPTTQRSGPAGSGNGSPTAGRFDQPSQLGAGSLCVLPVLEHRTQGSGGAGLVEGLASERVQGAGPVDRLRHARSLVEAHRAQGLDCPGHLASELLASLGDPSEDDRDLALEVWVLDPVVQGPAFEGIV